MAPLWFLSCSSNFLVWSPLVLRSETYHRLSRCVTSNFLVWSPLVLRSETYHRLSRRDNFIAVGELAKAKGGSRRAQAIQLSQKFYRLPLYLGQRPQALHLLQAFKHFNLGHLFASALFSPRAPFHSCHPRDLGLPAPRTSSPRFGTCTALFSSNYTLTTLLPPTLM
ncbi:BQ5605_C012g06707 [Microbotryum silenes-dioicae]|uniref:BQ5605_C012g06707 protein n=1 Tax=Microbotryum silenes-dioicae TaxID=796604 RepID=A0A2X0MD65_9BASI|nr:BQ5605_C012g06707 [Microbotryum silenes-dioicae]